MDDELLLLWEDGVPVSGRYADPYHARGDGLAEKRHVFLEGNGLPARWQGATSFRLAELGFGTGLTVLAALELWRRTAAPGAVLHVISFERWPLPREALFRALARWPAIAGPAAELVAAWPARWPQDCGPAVVRQAMARHRILLPGLCLDIVPGDARRAVPLWQGTADAWCLDGFAPARNPEMWEPALLADVHARTAPGGTVATYAAAGHVRRALAAAGFAVERRPGFGRKREMLSGCRPA